MDEETQHLLELRNILEHRRRLYERQKATLAPHVPVDLELGLATTIRELDAVEAKLRLPPLGADVQEAVGPDGAALTVEWRFRALERDLRKLLGEVVEGFSAQRSDTAAWRGGVDAKLAAVDAWIQAQDTGRKVGQRRTLWGVAALVLVGILMAGTLIWIAATLRAHGL